MNETQTGEAIPTIKEEQMELDLDNTGLDTEEEAIVGSRTIAIELGDDGKVNLQLDGDFQVHEVFGALYTTVADLTVQQFVHPGLKQVLTTTVTSDNNILSAINALAAKVDALETGATNETAEAEAKINKLAEGLEGLVASFANPGE